MKMIKKLNQLHYYSKEALEESIKAFKIGRECYFCDLYNHPTRCDMVRDETCKTSIIGRLLFSIEMFFIEYKFNKQYFERVCKNKWYNINSR